MNRFIVLILILFELQVFSQSFNSHKIALTPTASPLVEFNKDEYKKKLYAKYAKEPQNEDLDRYIESDAVYKQYFFASNRIYSNWQDATEYIKKVFSKAIPDGFNKDDVNIYLIRDCEPNAYCMEDGHIAVTVGLLPFISSEAELASILCHEYGHYYSNHLYNDFKKQNKNKHLKKFISSQSIIGSLLIVNDQYEFKKDQERQADTFAYHFFHENGYAREAIPQTYTHFKTYTEKYKNLKSTRVPLFYFATHPTDEERIVRAQVAIKSIEGNGNSYQVDSLEFLRIKQGAIDEVIYLLFENLDYAECLEMAYLQHLYKPNDEFYLFFIIECLRRQMEIYKGFGTQYFISGEYKELKPSEFGLSQKPSVLLGKRIKPVSQKDYLNSIFATFDKDIYNLSNDDIGKIEAKSLITNDTLEFLNNEEALAYFYTQIPENSCVFNINRLFLNQKLNANCNDNASENDLEKSFVFAGSNYEKIRNDIKAYNKAPVKLFDIEFINQEGKRYTDPVLFDEMMEIYKQITDKYESKFIDTKNEFNFREDNKIDQIVTFFDMLGMNRMFGKKSHELDFLKIFPEVSNEVSRLGYNKLIFVKLFGMAIGANNSSNILPYGERWGFSIYVIDLVKNKIYVKSAFSDMSNTGSRESKIRGLFYEVENVARE